MACFMGLTAYYNRAVAHAEAQCRIVLPSCGAGGSACLLWAQ
jgi:hypothetical protein